MSQNDRELEDVDEEVSPTTPIALLGEEQDVVAAPRRESILQSSKDVFLSCLPLGFITFGGPQAHIAILHDQFVEKRRWVTEQQFTELFALGQSLPGPTSTQLVIAVGTIRGGILGGLIAFFCFSLPAAIILTICGILFSNAEFEKNMPAALVEVQRGLSCVGVALVASASVKLMGKVATSKLAQAIMIIVACVTILYRPFWMFPVLMLAGGLVTLTNDSLQEKIKQRLHDFGIEEPTGKNYTWRNRIKMYVRLVKTIGQTPLPTHHVNNMESNEDLTHDDQGEQKEDVSISNLTLRPTIAALLLVMFAVILVTLIVLRQFITWRLFQVFESFFRMGSIIFGGGQVVVPMMLAELKDLVTDTQFFNGFAIVSALPGPMFNFSAYLGGVVGGVPGALLCWFALFLPAFLFIWGILPFWKMLREKSYIKRFITGVNAAAIGLVVAAVYLLWNVAVKDAYHAVTVVFAFSLTMGFDIPAPIVVVLGGFLSYLFFLIKLSAN